MTVTREVSWGDGLVVEAFKFSGGLRRAVAIITYEVGRHIGSRNTFAKLLRVASPSELGEKDLERAWYLLTTFGEEPADWGIPESVLPASVEPGLIREYLQDDVRHQGLEPRTRWLLTILPYRHIRDTA